MIHLKVSSAFTPVLLVTTILISTIANAQQTGQRHGPPPEAFEVCASQTEGAACSFSGKRGDVNGTCLANPRNPNVLSCAPERRRGPKN